MYQSQWTDKPMVHLLPHWNWEQFAGKEIPVQAFTNADSVELFLNGKSLGTREGSDMKELHYEWKVPFEPGTLKAVAKKGGKVVATDEVVTAGTPAKIELVADRSTIHADGDDLSFVTARVVDKDGHVCPNADNEISFRHHRPGRRDCHRQRRSDQSRIVPKPEATKRSTAWRWRLCEHKTSRGRRS